MRSALVICNRMDLVHNHGLDIAQNRAALLRGKKDVERLGRRHQNVRGPLQHGAPLSHQRVTGPHRCANLRHQQSTLPGQRKNLPERTFEIFLNIVSQSLKWRNVEDFRAVREISRQRLAYQAVNASQKCSEGLAGSGGGGDERGPPRENVWPSLLLRLRRSTEFTDKPLRDQRMRPCQRIRRGLHQNILARISIFRQPFARTTRATPSTARSKRRENAKKRRLFGEHTLTAQYRGRRRFCLARS